MWCRKIRVQQKAASIKNWNKFVKFYAIFEFSEKNCTVTSQKTEINFYYSWNQIKKQITSGIMSFYNYINPIHQLKLELVHHQFLTRFNFRTYIS